MKKLVVALFVIFAAVSCKDQEEVKPENVGDYLIYTNMGAAKFDRMEIKVNGATVGLLTKPFQATNELPSPTCGSELPGAVLHLQRPEGSYSLDAVATLKGKEVGVWEGSLRFEAGSCSRKKLVDD